MKVSIRFVLPILFMAISLLCLVSCSTKAEKWSNAPEAVIHRIGTVEYRRTAAGFKITLEEAEARLAEYTLRRYGDLGPKVRITGIHRIIVDDCYHFFPPNKTYRIPLTGYYVNGNTGNVEWREREGEVGRWQK
jgi:hypothetical protein